MDFNKCNIMKVIFYVDYSISFFKEITNSIKSRRHAVEETSNLIDADLALILQKPLEISKTISNIRKYSINIPILTTPTISNDRNIYFFNDRLLDLNINIFLNNLHGLEQDVVHVDCNLRYRGLNLRTEMIGMLSVINELHAITNVKYSFNGKNCLHINGYDNNRSFTFSCFIFNCSDSGFNESFNVYTRNNGVFKLDSGDMGRHSYSERYGASWDTIVENIVNGGVLKQEKIIDMLKIDRSLGSTTASTATKKRRSGFSGSRPEFGGRRCSTFA